MRVPIACTLTAEEQPSRLEEWRSFFARHVVSVESRSPAEVVLRLGEGDEPVLAAADLAQREQQCCAFFGFAISLRGDGRFLSVSVPDEAAPVLADFAGLLPEGLRG